MRRASRDFTLHLRHCSQCGKRFDAVGGSRFCEGCWQQSFDDAARAYEAGREAGRAEGFDAELLRDAIGLEELPAKLATELPGILQWALEGCQQWQQQGLDAPESVANATAGYRHDEDLLGRFLADCCVVDPHAETQSGQLWKVFCTWTMANHEDAGTQTSFGRQHTERGYEINEKARPRKRRGLRLLDEQDGAEC